MSSFDMGSNFDEIDAEIRKTRRAVEIQQLMLSRWEKSIQRFDKSLTGSAHWRIGKVSGRWLILDALTFRPIGSYATGAEAIKAFAGWRFRCRLEDN